MSISMPEAKKRVESAYPVRKVRRGLDYDKDCFIFEATSTGDEVDYSDTFYKVNKETGDITPTSPILIPGLIMRFIDDAVSYPKG